MSVAPGVALKTADGSLTFTVVADATHVFTVMRNFISNACKFCRPDTRIHLRAAVVDSMLAPAALQTGEEPGYSPRAAEELVGRYGRRGGRRGGVSDGG